MTVLTTRAAANIQDMAEILAAYPSPDKWTQEQKKQAVQFAALLDTAQKMIIAANLTGIDYMSEKEIFLKNAGKTGSTYTQIGYRNALIRLDTWAERHNVNPLELTPAQADDFIYSLRRDRAPASIRLDISATSSFFTWLERRHAGVKNPFRGTKARPGKKAVRNFAIPTEQEVKIITTKLPAPLTAAASVMAYRGLRAGALATMAISGDRVTWHSKGKDYAGHIPSAVLDAIKAASLPLRAPFAGILTNTLEKRIARAIEKLHKDGKVSDCYSCHDLRHFFAITEYRKDKDIHRVSGLLGHASIQITENYLKGLGEVE